MRKFLFSIAIASVLISCGKSIESAAKKMADLMCKAQEDKSNSIENLKYIEQIEKIEEKYSGDEKEKLQKLAEDLYLKKCGNKISSTLYDKSSDENSEVINEDIYHDPTGMDDTSISTNSDVDKMLDDYENYVDQYIVYLKKASKGDMTALSEYPSLMEKANQLQSSLQEAQNNNNFSADQMKRMVSIQQKMTNAAIDMQYSN